MDIGFEPQPGPQQQFMSCPVRDILFGGARGGGKTYGCLGHWWDHAERYGSEAKGLWLRRNYKELEDSISKGKLMFGRSAKLMGGGNRPYFVWHNGAVLKFRHLDRDVDVEKYQGFDLNWIHVEEAGNFPRAAPLDMLRATLRSASGVKTWFILTANPGGAGHNWLKSRYVDPSPPLKPFRWKQIVQGTEYSGQRVFIPARVEDNKRLLEQDPGYVSRLVASAGGQQHILKAWLEGDWDIVAGGMLDDVWDGGKHIIEPFDIPPSWSIYRAYDWGSSKPFSIGWWARSEGTAATDAAGGTLVFPPGTLIRIAEWYGTSGQPDEGLRMTEREIIKGVKEREQTIRELKGRTIFDGPADLNIFDVRDGKSLADQWTEAQIYWQRADKSPGSRITGWQELRQLLMAVREHPMEHPGLFTFSTCRDFIRTIPVLQRSPHNRDDVDTEGEDHIADETRYMIRFVPSVIEQVPVLGI